MTAEEMRRLSQWDSRRADESLHTYGARVLTFLLAHQLTGTLSDEDLQLADHVANIAVVARDITVPALTNISAIRHLIARTLKARAADSAASADSKPPTLPRTIEGGRLSPIEPQPIQRPPSGQKVEIAF